MILSLGVWVCKNSLAEIGNTGKSNWLRRRQWCSLGPAEGEVAVGHLGGASQKAQGLWLQGESLPGGGLKLAE